MSEPADFLVLLYGIGCAVSWLYAAWWQTQADQTNTEEAIMLSGNGTKKAEFWVSVCAGIVALSALGVSIWQGCATRAHQRLSVQPALTFHDGWADELDFVGIQLLNQGLGPARIDSLRICLDGQDVTGWKEVIERLKIDNASDWVQWFFVPAGSAYHLKAGQARKLFGLNDNDTDYEAEREEAIKAVIHRIDVIVTYCSMYNDCRIEYFQSSEASNACIE